MSWIGPILAALLKALLGFFAERKDAAQQRTDDRDTGALNAQAETDQTTLDIAQKQTDIAAAPHDVATTAGGLLELADEAERRSGKTPAVKHDPGTADR